MKKVKAIILIIILVGGVSTATFFIGRKIGLNTDLSSSNTTIENVEVSKRTITKTITSSGEIATASTEKLGLNTTKKFETMCVEEGDSVSDGENILEYTDGTYLTAPYNLVVSSYSVPDAESTCTSSNYVEVENTDDLQVSLSINENEISNISIGQEVEITLTADTSKTYAGTISKIDGVGTYSNSGTTFAVTVTFTNDGNAKLGMSVSCSINIEELTDVVTIPIDAVTTSDNKKYVEVVNEDGTTTKTEIETGLSDDEYVQVISGLEEGQKVQVTTVTKQNETRSTSNNSSSRDGKMQGGGPDSSGTSIPDMGGQQGGGQMPNMGGPQGSSSSTGTQSSSK